ncbi:MAG TPA: flagellar biosynthetic protein FliR [Burkholderiales bacterium]
MRISADLGWLLVTALIALRFGAALALTPILAFGSLPPTFRVLLVFALAALLGAAAGIQGVAPVDAAGFAAMAATEALLGALLGFGILAAFAAFQLGGRLLDLQLGFGVATLIDPATRGHAPLLGTLLWMTGVVVFFAIDGHLVLVRALALSLQTVPPGTPLDGLQPLIAVGQFGAMFTFALALVAPVVFVLLLVDTVVAVMARTMPQMNVFILSLPLKILVGLLTLALSVVHLGPVAQRCFESLFDMWESVLVR